MKKVVGTAVGTSNFYKNNEKNITECIIIITYFIFQTYEICPTSPAFFFSFSLTQTEDPLKVILPGAPSGLSHLLMAMKFKGRFLLHVFKLQQMPQVA